MSPARPTTVLVVEDDLSLRSFYRATLITAGYRVFTVEDGVNALQLIDSGTVPQVVVLDLGLPRLSGQDVLTELRSHPRTRHIPILVVTGSEARDLDVEEYYCVLRKPVAADALINAVANCLRQVVFLVPALSGLL